MPRYRFDFGNGAHWHGATGMMHPDRAAALRTLPAIVVGRLDGDDRLRVAPLAGLWPASRDGA